MRVWYLCDGDDKNNYLWKQMRHRLITIIIIIVKRELFIRARHENDYFPRSKNLRRDSWQKRKTKSAPTFEVHTHTRHGKRPRGFFALHIFFISVSVQTFPVEKLGRHCTSICTFSRSDFSSRFPVFNERRHLQLQRRPFTRVPFFCHDAIINSRPSTTCESRRKTLRRAPTFFRLPR